MYRQKIKTMKTNGKIEHGSGLHTTQYEKGILKDSKEQSMGRWQAQALFLTHSICGMATLRTNWNIRYSCS